MWYLHDGAPAHLYCAVWCVLNNTYHNRCINRGGITAWSPRPSGFLPVRTPKTLLHVAPVDNEETSWMPVRLLLTMKRQSWMPVRLSASTPTSQNECGSHVCTISWRTFWALIINVLSAITHKFNVSGHTLIWKFLLVLVCGTCVQNFPCLSVTPCMFMYKLSFMFINCPFFVYNYTHYIPTDYTVYCLWFVLWMLIPPYCSLYLMFGDPLVCPVYALLKPINEFVNSQCLILVRFWCHA
jgi:hypothetical protein